MENKLKQGEALFAEGKIEEAEKCFLDLLDNDPTNAEILNNLGVIYHARGNVQEAEGCFLKAIEAKEDYPDALLNLADLYQNAKRWEEAALQLEKSIAIDDQDHNLYNQLGMVYLEMGNIEKARIALKKSLELNPDQETVRDSLKTLEKNTSPSMDCKREIKKGKMLFAEGKVEEAEKCFLDLLKSHLTNMEILNNLGVIASEKEDIKKAQDYFLKALRIDPLYQDALNNLDTLRNPTTNLTNFKNNHQISTGLTNNRIVIINTFNNKFNDIYASYFSKKNEVQIINPKTEQDLSSVSEWADIIWCTWCNEPLVYLSHNKKSSVIVTHIRSYEILTPNLMKNVKWQNIDGTIFVADHIREIANQMWGEQLSIVPQKTIFNCVQLERYPFYQNGPGKNICYIGYLNHKKGIGLLLQCIKEAVTLDRTFQFHIAGDFQETRFEVYMKHLLKEMKLTDNVVFHGWVANVPDFLKDMNYVISTSPWEGCPNNIIEAMACGIKPLIHNWQGAKELFPDDLVFNSVGEFISILKKNNYDSGRYREWVATYFNASIQLPKIDNFMARMLEKQHSRNHVK